MRTALLGYTGFVGGNLAQQYSFTDLYNSQNIQELSGQKYDLVVCAAAPGLKWKANQDPESDRRSIDILTTALSQVQTKEFVLISTVDVYPVPQHVDESSVIPIDQQHPYGRHRLELEKNVQKLFDTVTVCRLPALYGPGLKKNFIYDLIHGRMLDATHPESQFQFYDMRELWKDIERVRQAKVPLINFVTEPLTAGTIAEQSRGITLTPGPTTKQVLYDIHTLHSEIFNTSGPYIADAETVLKSIVSFIQEEAV